MLFACLNCARSPHAGGGFCSAPLASLQRLSATACNCLPLSSQSFLAEQNPKRAGGGHKNLSCNLEAVLLFSFYLIREQFSEKTQQDGKIGKEIADLKGERELVKTSDEQTEIIK